MKTPISEKIKIMAHASGLTYAEAISRTRLRYITEHRQIMYIILQEGGHKVKEIGAGFRRDHSTIVHGIQTMKALIQKTPEGDRLREEYNLMSNALHYSYTGNIEHDYEIELTIARKNFLMSLLQAA